MNTQQEQRQWFNALVAHNSANVADTGITWLNTTREHAQQAINDIALPERKQETWRYSDLGRLYKQDYFYQNITDANIKDIENTQWIYASNESHRLVFANGRFVPGLSTSHALEENIRIGSLREMMSSEPELVSIWLEQTGWQKPDVFIELNRALIDDGAFILVPENVVLDRPVEVVYLNGAGEQNALAQPHSLIILEAGAQAKVIERFAGADSSAYFFNGVTGVSLGAHASLQHYRLQNESSNAHHISRIGLRQDTASEYSGVNIATGGAWSRTDISARFAGEHARCDLDGLYTVGDQQYTDFHLDVVHGLPHCSSRENFKGIVYGKGRAVFDGRILVEKDAQKTDAQLSNKNLLLTQHAEVDTKPQLEIHADDVKCSHGTTVGKLDTNQLFYLRSRGINADEARKMICLGFAEQVLSHVSDEPVHDFIHQQIAGIFGRQDTLS
jgi:Fe-S cluster assembly protein SufD